MKNKRKFILPFLFLLLLGVVSWIKKFPDAVLALYTKKTYPYLYFARSWFFDRIPFSVGDILYAFAIVLILRSILLFRWRKRKQYVFGIFNTAMVVWIWFQLSWGLNYHATQLFDPASQYSEEQLQQITAYFAEQVNQLHSVIETDQEKPIELPYSTDELIAQIVNEKHDHSIRGKAKVSLFSLPLTYMGFSGYLNPFTLEAQINGNIPSLSMPITIAHEMAHQQGYAAEQEANFIAFMRIYQHHDPAIRYAAHLFAFRYCYSELYRAFPEKARCIRDELRPGIIANIRITSQFWKAYKNPLEPFFKKSYDRYLKANDQKKGIQSYSQVVALLISSFNAENKAFKTHPLSKE